MEKHVLLTSVIVPAFNAERKISRCINSLLNQEYEKIEIIVVDDGSTDNTLKILEDFSNEGKIILLKQTRKGPGSAKNLASGIAKGEILVFVDSDEYPLPDYISKLTKPLRESKAKTSIGAWYVANPTSPWARCRFEDSHMLRKHAVKSGVFRAIKKDFFRELGGFDVTKGYSDDRIPNNDKRVRIDKAIFLHDVDSTLGEIYQKKKWVGSSVMKNPKNIKFKIKLFTGFLFLIALIYSILFNFLIIFILLMLLVLFIFVKSVKKSFFYKDIRLIFYYPIYVLISGIAMIHGFVSPVYSNKRK